MVFPIGDDNTGRVRTPYVTYLIIALNVLVFVALIDAISELLSERAST